MDEPTYKLPQNGDGAGTLPESANGQEAVNRETVTLEEMNAKLDAILAALGGREN